jgi:hypothetical protein
MLPGQEAFGKHDRRSVSTSLYVITGHCCVTNRFPDRGHLLHVDSKINLPPITADEWSPLLEGEVSLHQTGGSGQLHAPVALSPGKKRQFPLTGKPRRSQCWCGRSGDAVTTHFREISTFNGYEFQNKIWRKGKNIEHTKEIFSLDWH